MSWTTPRTWIYGELVTVSMMNQQIRDNENALWVGTTAGDIDYYTGATNRNKLGIGTAGEVLRVKSGATAPEWGSPLSGYGSFTVSTIGSLASTSWADISGATVNVSLLTTSTLIALASFEAVKTSGNSGWFRWMLDGTAQPESKLEYHAGGSFSHPGAIVGTKINVPAGTRICKLQYYVSGYTITFQNILGIVLGFAE